VVGVGHRRAERGQRLQQDLTVLTGGNPSRRERAAVTGAFNVEVDRLPRVPGAQVVHVSTVRGASVGGAARRHQRLRGDVPAHDVVVDVVQLVGDEVTVGELVDAQRRDDVGQRQGSEDHLGIMPQRRSPVVAALSARAARPCWR